MKNRTTITSALSILSLSGLLYGCGDSGDGDGDGGPLKYSKSFTCNSVPACYSNALAAVRASLSESVLTLGPLKINSGRVEDLTCSKNDLTVEFSAFSERPTGLVPTPSTVTLKASGTECAKLSWGDGSHTDGATGTTTKFELFAVKTPNSDEVKVLKFENGVVGVECSVMEGYGAASGALEQCADAVVVGSLKRDDKITQIDLELIDINGGSESLFTCK